MCYNKSNIFIADSVECLVQLKKNLRIRNLLYTVKLQ